MNSVPASTDASDLFDRLVDLLDAEGYDGQYQAHCPSHDDSRPSLNIGLAPAGDRVMLYCHAGCDLEDILETVGMAGADLTVSNALWTPNGPATDVYEYVDEAGDHLMWVGRLAGKKFIALHRTPRGRTEFHIRGVRRVLYRLPAVIAAAERGEVVYVVEGEKDVDRLRAEGIVATCNFGGAGKWGDEYSAFLVGAEVVVVRDRDAAGEKHASKVLRSLTTAGVRATLCEAATGNDVSDHLDAGHSLDELVAVEPDARASSASSAESDELPWLTGEALATLVEREVEWIAEPYLAKGVITDLSAQIKDGKTTFALTLVKAVTEGKPFLGATTRQMKVIYLSEERPATIGHALRRADIDPALVYVLPGALPSGRRWPDVAAQVVAKAKEAGAELIIVDTAHRWANLQGDDENRSGDATAAIKPLEDTAGAGLAVLTLRHHRKSGGEVQSAARGSTAFGGAVDVLLSLHPGKHQGQRVLKGISRLTDMPPSTTIVLTDGTYELVGSDGESIAKHEAAGLLQAIRKNGGRDLSREDLHEISGLPRKTTDRMADQLHGDGELERERGGRTGNKYLYSLPAEAEKSD